MNSYLETTLSKRMRLRVTPLDANLLTFNKELREKLSNLEGKIDPKNVFTYLVLDKTEREDYTIIDKRDLAKIIIQINADDEEGAGILEEWIKRVYGEVSKSSYFYVPLTKEIAAKNARVLHYFFDIVID